MKGLNEGSAVQESQSQCQALTGKLQQMQAEQDTHDELAAKLKSALQQCSELTQQAETMRHELNAAIQHQQTTQGQLQALQQRSAAEAEGSGQLHGQLQEDLQQLQKQLTQKDEFIEGLQGEVAGLTEAEAEAQAQVAELKAFLEDREAQVCASPLPNCNFKPFSCWEWFVSENETLGPRAAKQTRATCCHWV